MRKQSSYRKLKSENESLKADIYNLVRNADKYEGIVTSLKYKLRYDVEDVLMGGEQANEGSETGVIAKIEGNEG